MLFREIGVGAPFGFACESLFNIYCFAILAGGLAGLSDGWLGGQLAGLAALGCLG